jgi:hypothetical protein
MTAITIDIPDGYVVVIAKAANCHPDRPVNGRGLCNSCYTIAHRTGTLELHDRARPTRTVDEFAAEYELLRSDGLGRRRIAERLGVTRAAVDKAYIAAVSRGLLTPDRRTA